MDEALHSDVDACSKLFERLSVSNSDLNDSNVNDVNNSTGPNKVDTNNSIDANKTDVDNLIDANKIVVENGCNFNFQINELTSQQQKQECVDATILCWSLLDVSRIKLFRFVCAL
ncbi:hypothetical protein HELRODRAFT_170770 [Helobdella robusta]|uniref:Uncharacterized protein n=1 Tax=Helobdella robusta TaxID=6412 RepID=T1F3E6_HELRO|nr:hypothetical protein HELRODRAFT_170770 [Helobdella robusta]ESO07435.1 hypothetical protein HELRODRAFT_170770 [Helobdella robusta]